MTTNRLFSALAAALIFVLLASPSYGLSSYCGIGYIPEIDKDSPYHDGYWTAQDNWFGDMYWRISSIVTGASSGSRADIFEMGFSGGYIGHFHPDPNEGEHYINGNTSTGYPINGWEAYAVTSCSHTGIVDNIPDPTVSVTISPGPVVNEGTSVTIIWQSSNTDACTYNGSPIALSGNWTFNATPSHAGTHTATCTGNGGPPASDSVTLTVIQNCSISISVSSPNNFMISSTPAMPAINASVTALNPPGASVSWNSYVTYTAPGSSCSGGPTFTSNTVTGSGSTFSPNFSGIYGGTLYVTATCNASGYNQASATSTHSITATEPSTTSKASQLGSASSPLQADDFKQIACHESGVTQFSSGLPLLGGGGDAGVMQICFMRTAGDMWNWQTNIATGKSIANGMKTTAKSWLDMEVAGGASPYSTPMWRDETVHRYNAGTGMSGDAYWEWNPSLSVWNIVDRGGVGGYVPSVNSASCPGV